MKHTFMVTFSLLMLFFIAQIIGLLITQSYIDFAESAKQGSTVWKELPSLAGVQLERPEVSPQASVILMVVALLVGTFIILLIIKLQKIFLWKLWFYLAIVFCLQIAFASFLSSKIALILSILLSWFKVFKPNVYVHNFTEIFVYGGLAAIFVPLLSVFYAFCLMILLSLYDMYAVWKSKHMIAMAHFQTKSGIFAGLLIPYNAHPRFKKKGKAHTAVLGGGDIGFPLILAGTVMASSTIISGIIVAIGATLALLGLLILGQKGRFYPAIPFLTFGCLLGYLATFLL